MQGICARQRASRRRAMHARRRCRSHTFGAPVATLTAPCMRQPVSSRLKPRPAPVTQAPAVVLPPLTPAAPAPHNPQPLQRQTLRLLQTLARALATLMEAGGTTQTRSHSNRKLRHLLRVQVQLNYLSHKVRTVLKGVVVNISVKKDCPMRLICLPSFPATRKVVFGKPWASVPPLEQPGLRATPARQVQTQMAGNCSRLNLNAIVRKMLSKEAFSTKQIRAV